MSKFFRLCSCEFTKIMKKKSTKVMLIILVLSLFAAAGMTVLTKKAYDITDMMYSDEENYKNQINLEKESIKSEINNENLDTASKNRLQAQVDIYDLAIENNINMYNTYWKQELLLNIANIKTDIYNYKSLGNEEQINTLQTEIDKKIELIKNDDFAGYIQNEKNQLKTNFDNGIIPENSYNTSKSLLDLKEKYEIGKNYNSEETWKNTLVNEISALQENIDTGIDSITGKTLKEDDIKKANENIKINEYRLEHNLAPFLAGESSMGSTRKVYDYMMVSFTFMVLAVMIIIIAGSSISSEISKGTIKFWTFTPNKRWKILLSKLFVDTVILIVTTIIITLISALVGNMFFGSANAQPYLYVSNGTVHELNYLVYTIAYNLISAIDIFMFLLLAMMISTIAKNTAVAVGVSIAAYLGGATIMQILNMFITSDWIKFVPFNNLGLVSKIFTNDMSYSTTQMMSSATGNISVGFSIVVLGISAFLMIVTMFDSFRKRDIK